MRILVFILIFFIFASIMTNVNVKGEEVSRTTIRGTITDSETGLPVKDAYVMVRNYTREIFFYYITSENGSYEFSIGAEGNFIIEVDGTAHHYYSTEISIGRFEAIVIDIQIDRYEHNFMAFFYNEDRMYPLENLDVIITDEGRDEETYQTDQLGWLNTTLEYGNYTFRTSRDFLHTQEDSFNVSYNKVYRRYYQMRAVNVFENASKKLTTEPLIIPSKEFRAIRIINEEPTHMYLDFQADDKVTFTKLTQKMFDMYLSVHTGEPYPHEEEPCYDYDGRFGTMYGGGGTIGVWTIPYYIVFENNNTETITIEYDLYYEYGEPRIASIESGPLEPVVDLDEVETTPNALSALSLSTVIFSVMMMSYILVKMRRK